MRSLWQVAPLLDDGSLVQVLCEIPTPRADIVAVFPEMKRLPRRIGTTFEHLTRGLADRLPDIG